MAWASTAVLASNFVSWLQLPAPRAPRPDADHVRGWDIKRWRYPARRHQASPRTIAAYRDALKLLLEFIHARTGKLPSQLDWNDLYATMISGFLTHLETTRGNSIRTRNVRLTAIRSLFA